MKSLSGVWWGLLLLVLLVLDGAWGWPSNRGTLCNLSCCSGVPSCTDGARITCDCPGEQITLREGSIPKTAQNVTILHSTSVIVEDGAIRGLNSLVNFTISHVQRLECKEGGMSPHNQTSMLSVVFENVSSILVEEGSFSGMWGSQTTIQMHRIGQLDVESYAFGYQTNQTDDMIGLSVTLRDVKQLNLNPSGLSAPIYDFAMTNVTMDTCHEQSFGEMAFSTEWNNVTIENAKDKCFHSLNDMSSLKIISLRLNNTQPGAFSGKVNDLIIERSHFNTVQTHGFNISVTTMCLTKSTIHELLPESLNVFVGETIRLETTTIKHLRRNALIGIKMDQNREDLDPRTTLNRLTITNAEKDSLSLSPCSKVRMVHLDMLNPWPRICPAYKWAQSLTGGGTDDWLTPVQYQLYMQLFRWRMCSEESWTRFPKLVKRSSCPAEDRQVGAVTAEDAASPV